MINETLILLEFFIIGFTIYVLKIYCSNSKKKPLPNNMLLFILIMLSFYMIIISYFIKLPSSAPFYLYSCYGVKILPLPKYNDTRCTNMIIFNLTSPLEVGKITNIKPTNLNKNNMYLFGTQYNECLIQKNTIFLYYCMNYATTDSNLYYIKTEA